MAGSAEQVCIVDFTGLPCMHEDKHIQGISTRLNHCVRPSHENTSDLEQFYSCMCNHSWSFKSRFIYKCTCTELYVKHHTVHLHCAMYFATELKIYKAFGRKKKRPNKWDT